MSQHSNQHGDEPLFHIVLINQLITVQMTKGQRLYRPCAGFQPGVETAPSFENQAGPFLTVCPKVGGGFSHTD